MNPVRNPIPLGIKRNNVPGISNGVNEKAAVRKFEIPTGGGHAHLLDELQSLLEAQIELVHQGGVIDSERLSTQAGRLVEKIAQAGILELSEFKSRRNRLQKLYQELHLALSVQKADIAEKLSHVRKGKKIIQIYRKNI